MDMAIKTGTEEMFLVTEGQFFKTTGVIGQMYAYRLRWVVTI